MSEEPPAPAAVNLDAEQLAAVERCLSHGVSVLLGEPGTGKTTVIAEIYKRERALGRKVLIVAPTAKAASRARSVVQGGVPTTTANKLFAGSTSINANVKWKWCTLIVDETSMATPRMIVSVLRTLRRMGDAEPCVTRVVFVGDVNQLRPASGVSCLLELSKAYPCSTLTNVYRQNAGTALYENIKMIKTREVLRLEDFACDESFEVVDLNSCVGWKFLEQRVLQKQELPAVLCLTNEERAMVTKVVQEIVNPDGIEVISANRVGGKFPAQVGIRVGDPVVCTKNTYAKSDSAEAKALAGEEEDSDGEDDDLARGEDVLLVSNGTPGVMSILPGTTWKRAVKYRTVAPDGRDADFWDDEDPHRGFGKLYHTKFEHAYALTVHKSQGDQYPEVVAVVEPGNNRRSERSLLYTAVSRARSKCVLCTSNAALSQMHLPNPHARSALWHELSRVRATKKPQPF
jgi:exodeoxyribonuclease V alpha subunit